jgi:hypothetical protein
VEYGSFSTRGLRSRVVKAFSIRRAWKTSNLQPPRIQNLSLGSSVLHVLSVPWSDVFVALTRSAVFLQDWRSGIVKPVPSRLRPDMPFINMFMFWNERLQARILAVHRGSARM